MQQFKWKSDWGYLRVIHSFFLSKIIMCSCKSQHFLSLDLFLPSFDCVLTCGCLGGGAGDLWQSLVSDPCQLRSFGSRVSPGGPILTCLSCIMQTPLGPCSQDTTPQMQPPSCQIRDYSPLRSCSYIQRISLNQKLRWNEWFVFTIGGVVRISQGLKSYGEEKTNV